MAKSEGKSNQAEGRRVAAIIVRNKKIQAAVMVMQSKNWGRAGRERMSCELAQQSERTLSFE